MWTKGVNLGWQDSWLVKRHLESHIIFISPRNDLDSGGLELGCKEETNLLSLSKYLHSCKMKQLTTIGNSLCIGLAKKFI